MKSKKKSVMLLILIGLIMLHINSFLIKAAENTYSVDFEDGTFGVLETEGNWTIVTEDNNKYAKCDDDIMDVPRLVIDRDVADFDIVFDVKQVNVNRSDANFGISARRSSDASNQYDIQYNGVDDFFEINRYYQGVKETLNMYQDEIKVTTGTWCTLGVKVKDNVISWYKDGKIVVSGTDSEELILSGDIKLFAYGVTICIDNIKYGEAGSIFTEEEPKETREVTKTPEPTEKPTPKETIAVTNKPTASSEKDSKAGSERILLIFVIVVSVIIIAIAILVLIKTRKGRK